MQYQLVVLETPFCEGLAQLEEQGTRLVNDAIASMKAKGYDLANVEIFDSPNSAQVNPSSGIWRIACHFGKE